jgi:hypothetical protein
MKEMILENHWMLCWTARKGGEEKKRGPYVLVAFTSAESEYTCIVAHEGDALAWVAWLRAEITSFDPHLVRLNPSIPKYLSGVGSCGWGMDVEMSL